MSYDSDIRVAESDPYKKANFYNTYHLFIRRDRKFVANRREMIHKLKAMKRATNLRSFHTWVEPSKFSHYWPGEGVVQYVRYRVYITVQEDWTYDQEVQFKREYEKVRAIYGLPLCDSLNLINPDTAPYSKYAT